MEFYNFLLPLEIGTQKLETTEDHVKAKKMKNYMMRHFDTDQIKYINPQDLK